MFLWKWYTQEYAYECILEATGRGEFIELLGCLSYFHGNEAAPKGCNSTLKGETSLSFFKGECVQM